MRDIKEISAAQIGAGVKALRDALSFTQEDFAHLLGVRLAAVQRWEAGKNSPGGQVLVKMLNMCQDQEARAMFGVAQVPDRDPGSVQASNSGTNTKVPLTEPGEGPSFTIDKSKVRRVREDGRIIPKRFEEIEPEEP